MEVVVASLKEVQEEVHKVVLASAGASFLEEQIGQKFQEQIIVGAYQVVEGGYVIFLVVTHHAAEQ